MIIFGLGNPGEKYAQTRHNVGFMFLDSLQADWNLPEFKFNKKFNAELSENNLSLLERILTKKEEKFILAKPQTFMNRSGEAVCRIANFYKQPPEKIIVTHDDLDLTIGNYKISTNSSSAGHNGVQSIIDCLGTKNFIRLRIGIELKEGRLSRKIPGQKFVLQKFSEEETKILQTVFRKIKTELETTLLAK